MFFFRDIGALCVPDALTQRARKTEETNRIRKTNP